MSDERPVPQESKPKATKAERRALQEAQRAAKAAKKQENVASSAPPKNEPKTEKPVKPLIDSKKTKDPSGDLFKEKECSQPKPVSGLYLFKHLVNKSSEESKNFDISKILPVFKNLGALIKEGSVRGSSERCLAFIAATATMISELKMPEKSVETQNIHNINSFGSTLMTGLDDQVAYIRTVRPLAVTTLSFIQFLKGQSREELLQVVDDFKKEQIEMAACAIHDLASKCINSGEKVCTFGYSSLIADVILHAWEKTKSDPDFLFSVLVVDAAPLFEARKMLKVLNEAGVPCKYCFLDAVPSISSTISLVLLGAHSLLSNGHVLARIGSAQLAACVPHAPVIVCAETYKFWDQAFSDAYEYNEFASSFGLLKPEALVSNTCFPGSKKQMLYEPEEASKLYATLNSLHLEYDVLPARLVTAVVTELGTLPTTSVPVILRVKQTTSAIPVV